MTEAAKTKYIRAETSIMGNRASEDGVTHINIHSRSKTALGAMLSHFSHSPFTHPYFGPFYSMEGLWYHLRAKNSKDKEVEHACERLRYLSGYRAKIAGKHLPYVWYADFKEDVMAANYQKIIQNQKLYDLFIESELPFDHYYTFGDSDMHITPNNFKWLCDGFEEIRTALKHDLVPQCWVNAEARYKVA